MKTLENQVLALAGIAQATYLVDQVAQRGQCHELELETCVNSLFVTDPVDVQEVFGERDNVRTGLRLLKELFHDRNESAQRAWVSYTFAAMHLETKLSSDTSILDTVGKGLESAKLSRDHFGANHENTLAKLADTYQRTVSTFGFRIQVQGHRTHLEIERNAAKIRTLLLAGIRSAMLWKQVGGHRWHLLFKRKKIGAEAARQLEIV